MSYTKAPELTIDSSVAYRATIETDKGKIEIDLFAGEAPLTVNNFVFLARDGYYDGLIFHRVIPNFMIQGGDPTGTGRGGPGYKFRDEVVDNPHRHGTGALSMANAGPNTNGSQFLLSQIGIRVSHILEAKRIMRPSDDAHLQAGTCGV